MVLWALRVHTQTSSWSVQSFFGGADACDPAADRRIHRPHHLHICVAVDRIPCYSKCNVMRPKSYFAAPRPARRSIGLLTSDVSYARFQIVTPFWYFQSKKRLKLFAVSVWSNFDSIFKLLKITLVASSNANEVEDIDHGQVSACPSVTLYKGPFLWENAGPT